MHISINCETCEHGNVCKYIPDSRKQLADRIKNALRPVITDPFMLTISCPHYTYFRKNYNDYAHVNSTTDINATSTSETFTTATLETYPTATLQGDDTIGTVRG